ncbi:MAG: hypothetical protein ABIH65_01480 [Nanoarchaeota archaeon]
MGKRGFIIGALFIFLIFLVSTNNISAQEDSNLLACYDTDGGRNYNLNGTLTIGTGIYKDQCLNDSGKTLLEYYCNSTSRLGYSYEFYICPENSCRNGACAFPPQCKDNCTSLGYNCGVHSICGVATNCGYCIATHTCNELGKCVPITNQTNQTCIPNINACSNRICGLVANGTCGTMGCGTCQSGYNCNINGQCILSTNQTFINQTNLTLISPNGGEVWIIGKTYAVGWATNIIPQIYLNYQPWIEILTPNSDIAYTFQSSDTMVNNDDFRFGRGWPFTVPTDKGLDGKYLVRVVIKDSAGNSLLSLQSKDYIHISNNPVIRDCQDNISSQISPPFRNSEFGNLGLDISKHPEIIRYRIQWFSGGWSEWYTPGVDDIDWKLNDDGTKRRVWGYFGDHTHEIETCNSKILGNTTETRNYTENQTSLICKNGCKLNGDCYPYNNRKSEKYCAVGGNWITQVQDNGTCENHFECSSYVCVSEKCVEGDLIQKILAWFRKLFS